MTTTNHSPQPAAKAYWIVLATIQEPSQFAQYASAAAPVIASYGGRVLARGDVSQIVEGSFPGRPYLIEFPNYAEAKACFHSPGYQKAIGLREGIAQFNIVITEGFMPEKPV